jgi:hypothetical protein
MRQSIAKSLYRESLRSTVSLMLPNGDARQLKLAADPLPLAPARSRHATFDWVASLA